ncbi:Cyclic pyranopterin monophosphate synthase [Pontiella desulfatans]|uniref:cyclic pyranopterin monophosphate synthase n=1 Tax=Pontiella desulfatans TaxID=2750659 RepID=A0A6C2U640_PONDE|nr:cyclic pyranopterin monophosphate synthase MoaC [Pontiella desulfatans]VGO15480.1 Cyclic pyranopterin monophosphate synthase [Pontiella desulfatans]
MNELTHIGNDNRPAMVDVGDKAISHRMAKAKGFIKLEPATLELIGNNALKKGNVLITAELAGTQAAKKTFDLIPLCHTLLLSKVQVKAELKEDGAEVVSEVKCTGQTGVEMEALTAVSVALLTIYDMCKAVDKNMELGRITLIEKKKETVTE